MDTAELVRAIAERKNTNASLIQIDQIIKDALDIISQRLSNKESIHLAGFGSFALSETSVKPIGKYVSVSRRRKASSTPRKRKAKNG